MARALPRKRRSRLQILELQGERRSQKNWTRRMSLLPGKQREREMMKRQRIPQQLPKQQRHEIRQRRR